MGALDGKVFVVTGANTGMGRIAAQAFAAEGAHVLLACRSEAKTAPVVQAIRETTGNHGVEFVPLDLGDLDSVHACADALLARGLPIHCLVNNAGVAGIRGMTKSGFEMHFGINHIGHFVLTLRLLDRIKQSAPARIVTVSSRSHYEVLSRPNWDRYRSTSRSPTGLREYAASKLANVLFTHELAKRLQGSGVTTYAVDPGTVATDIWQRGLWKPVAAFLTQFMTSAEDGARTTIHCAMSDAVAHETGLYYKDCAPRRVNKWAQDDELAAELWRKSAEWTGVG